MINVRAKRICNVTIDTVMI